MYPNQSGRTLDKENDIVTENNPGRTGTTGPGGLHANLVKQNSLMGSRTPSKQQQQGLKMNTAGSKTPMQQQGKVSNLGLNSPSASSILRTKTNYQLPPSAPIADTNNNPTNTNQKKKSGLARTFSTSFESNNNVNNNNSTTVPSTPVKTSDSRRLSLTKRGSAKARLVVHKDEPAQDHIAEAPVKINIGASLNIITTGGGGDPTISHQPQARLVEAAPLESATTTLSIERSLESEDKVIVGQAKAETKRRALTNLEDKLEIEYCPPPVEEQPYEPDFEEISYEVLKTVPPPMAYQFTSLDYSEPPLPDFELAPTQRPSRAFSSSPELSDTEVRIPVAKTTLTADGHLDVTWSDDDNDGDDEGNDGSPHPLGSISYNHSGPISSGRRFGIKDLPNEDKLRPPFDGFMFELDGVSSEDCLSEDEDDIFGSIGTGASISNSSQINKDNIKREVEVDDFNKAFGLDDLEDESKVQAPFSDFSFEL
ncbi:hypothetical protein BGZ96_002183 [Linnemannia gamsii]|uniref:Uncharacterized protein n=1 Tax=Linnemannia gamsii TaxID=64522 RepID=A0ABQ7K9U1_9FUNG|nr:hypothetical protein BGZ96_002183 [Linnemannia gamsii]